MEDRTTNHAGERNKMMCPMCIYDSKSGSIYWNPDLSNFKSASDYFDHLVEFHQHDRVSLSLCVLALQKELEKITGKPISAENWRHEYPLSLKD